MKNYFLKSAMLIMSVAFLGCSGSDDTACPEGFTGSSCNTKITPVAMYISKIVVKTYPSTDSEGNDWDNGEDNSGDKPDMFFVLQSGEQVLYSNEYKTDCSGEQTYTLSNPIGADDVASPISLSVWDFDGGDPQTNSTFMSGANFILYDAVAFDFPSVRTISGTNFAADIYVTYEW